jgi:riboflavin kinase / FMN adenylyltransferase
MRLVESKEQLESVVPGQVLTIGNFDGVHAGHQKILQQARATAQKMGAPGVAVLTFFPHPAAILYPERSFGVLTPQEIKVQLLDRQQVDTLIIAKDSYEMLNLSPTDFVDKFLMQHIKPSAVVEGPNFNFGYGRSGDVKTLASLGSVRGFKVVIVPPAEMTFSDGMTAMISSSMTRRLLEEGKVGEAARVLTRPYRLIGETVRGRGKGTEIGFPTANIETAEQIIPAEGVYAGLVEIGDTKEELLRANRRIPAAFSIGRAKTFVQDYPLLIEAHLLIDDVPDLGGKWLAMDFVEWVRHQRRFGSPQELVAQVARDCGEVRRILGAK